MCRGYNMSRFAEFFEGDNGRLSMPRLMVFCTLPISSYVVVLHDDQLVNYLGAYVISYAVGKVSGIWMKDDENAVASSESQTTIVQSSSTVVKPSGVEG